MRNLRMNQWISILHETWNYERQLYKFGAKISQMIKSL